MRDNNYSKYAPSGVPGCGDDGLSILVGHLLRTTTEFANDTMVSSMSHTFISYSRRDTEIVDRITGTLKDAGMEVWIDREGIEAGNQWRVQIVEAIDTCDAFVLMLSPHSAASDNVRKEIDLAQDSGRTIFAIMLEPVKLPAVIRYQLAGLQFIDVQMLGFEEAVGQLVGTLKKHIVTLKPLKEPTTRQAELVIQGIDLKSFNDEKQEQLLDFIAQLSSASRSQLKIANLSAGSVHVFVDMPSKSAYELKTLALNQDKRFKQHRITCLRLAGDIKYVNVSFGIFTATATISFLRSLWLRIPSLLSPLIGSAAGKILTLLLALGIITGLALMIPKTVGPSVLPPSTPTAAPTSTPTSIPTPTFAPTVTPILTSTPTITPTINLTPDANIIFLKGITAELVECKGNPFVFSITDPDGIDQVYIEFAVAGFEVDFSKIYATLDLTNIKGDTWSGTFDDTISERGKVTYWRVIVVDKNEIKTVYREERKFSYFAGNKGCP